MAANNMNDTYRGLLTAVLGASITGFVVNHLNALPHNLRFLQEQIGDASYGSTAAGLVTNSPRPLAGLFGACSLAILQFSPNSTSRLFASGSLLAATGVLMMKPQMPNFDYAT